MRGERMLKSALAVIRGRVPGARALVQRGLELAVRAVQLGAQHVAEQAMVAVALAGAVERHEREVGTLQPLEHLRRAGPFQQRIADRRGHDVQDRASQDEPPLVLGQV